MNNKKWHQEPMFKAEEEEEEEEEEDTLSLCDLPIFSDASEWEKLSASGSHSTGSVSSSLSSKSDLFEFFSEEWSKKPQSSNLAPENIIFCGKLIPHKDPVPQKKARRKSSRKGSCVSDPEPAESKALALQETEPSSALLRSRWFLFLFGTGGFPKEMDLKDIKNRQSRKTASSPQREYRGNRLRWMIRALSCGDSDGQVHAQAIVKASIGCIAQM